MENWFFEQAKVDIENLGDAMQAQSQGIEADLIKIRVPLKSHKMSASKGPRVIGKVSGSRLVILFVYTHDEFAVQPKWKDIAARLDESTAA